MTKQITPLRQRMLDDMALRNMSPATQRVYINAVKNFSVFFGRSPDKLTFEDVRTCNYSGPDVLRRDGVSGVGYFFANRAASMVLASSRSNSSGSNSSPIQSIRSACSGWVGLARMASISS